MGKLSDIIGRNNTFLVCSNLFASGSFLQFSMDDSNFIATPDDRTDSNNVLAFSRSQIIDAHLSGAAS